MSADNEAFPLQPNPETPDPTFATNSQIVSIVPQVDVLQAHAANIRHTLDQVHVTTRPTTAFRIGKRSYDYSQLIVQNLGTDELAITQHYVRPLEYGRDVVTRRMILNRRIGSAVCSLQERYRIDDQGLFRRGGTLVLQAEPRVFHGNVPESFIADAQSFIDHIWSRVPSHMLARMHEHNRV